MDEVLAVLTHEQEDGRCSSSRQQCQGGVGARARPACTQLQTQCALSHAAVLLSCCVLCVACRAVGAGDARATDASLNERRFWRRAKPPKPWRVSCPYENVRSVFVLQALCEASATESTHNIKKPSSFSTHSLRLKRPQIAILDSQTNPSHTHTHTRRRNRRIARSGFNSGHDSHSPAQTAAPLGTSEHAGLPTACRSCSCWPWCFAVALATSAARRRQTAFAIVGSSS